MISTFSKVQFRITMGPVSSSFLTILLYKILPVGNILMPHYLNVYLNIKKFWKQETNIHTRGGATLPANGLSADSTIIDPCSAPHGFTRYSSRMRTFSSMIEYSLQAKSHEIPQYHMKSHRYH